MYYEKLKTVSADSVALGSGTIRFSTRRRTEGQYIYLYLTGQVSEMLKSLKGYSIGYRHLSHIIQYTHVYIWTYTSNPPITLRKTQISG